MFNGKGYYGEEVAEIFINSQLGSGWKRELASNLGTDLLIISEPIAHRDLFLTADMLATIADLEL